jgi:methyl coenzyme M reductase alpha subunit
MERIKWMWDESAKHKKINQLALEFGHQDEKRYLISSAEEAGRVDTFNTRSVPKIAFAESDP